MSVRWGPAPWYAPVASNRILDLPVIRVVKQSPPPSNVGGTFGTVGQLACHWAGLTRLHAGHPHDSSEISPDEGGGRKRRRRAQCRMALAMAMVTSRTNPPLQEGRHAPSLARLSCVPPDTRVSSSHVLWQTIFQQSSEEHPPTSFISIKEGWIDGRSPGLGPGTAV